MAKTSGRRGSCEDKKVFRAGKLRFSRERVMHKRKSKKRLKFSRKKIRNDPFRNVAVEGIVSHFLTRALSFFLPTDLFCLTFWTENVFSILPKHDRL